MGLIVTKLVGRLVTDEKTKLVLFMQTIAFDSYQVSNCLLSSPVIDKVDTFEQFAEDYAYFRLGTVDAYRAASFVH